MPLVIHCPQCAKRYQVAGQLAGKQVRCQQCQTAFVAAAPAIAPAATSLPPLDPFGANDPFAASDLGGFPTGPAPTNPLGPANPLGTPAAGSFGNPYLSSLPAASAWQPGVSNPSGGPTDLGMRLVSGAMLSLGLLTSIGSVALEAATGGVYLFVVALAPLMLILGIAGLISPNVVRAVGKYGGHLPWQYKAVGWALMGLYVVILVLLMVGLFAAGFQPDRPGRPRAGVPATIEPIRFALGDPASASSENWTQNSCRSM